MKHEMNFFSKIITQAPTRINWHLMIGECWMATKTLQLLKGGGTHVISFLKNKSSLPCPLGQLKFFNCHPIIGICWMVTKTFWVPPYGNHGNQIFLIATKGWLMASFFKSFHWWLFKNMWHAFFLGDG